MLLDELMVISIPCPPGPTWGCISPRITLRWGLSGSKSFFFLLIAKVSFLRKKTNCLKVQSTQSSPLRGTSRREIIAPPFKEPIKLYNIKANKNQNDLRHKPK